MPGKSIRISRGNFLKLNTSLSPDAFLNKLNFYLENKIFDSPNFSRMHLSFMKKRNLNQTAVLLNESLNDTNNSLHTKRYLIALDNSNYRILKPPPLIKKKTPPRNIWEISFDKKSIATTQSFSHFSWFIG